MMKQFLMVRDSDEVIQGTMLRDDPDAGPLQRPPSPVPDGVHLVEWAGEFDRGAHPETAIAICVDGVPVWEDPRDIDELRAAKSAEINASWMGADSTAFFYAGEFIGAQADDIVRINSINGYIGLMDAMPPDWPGVWKTKANTFIPLPDVEAWKPFYAAFVMKGVTNYIAAQSLKAQVATATTPAEIVAIAWPA